MIKNGMERSENIPMQQLSLSDIHIETTGKHVFPCQNVTPLCKSYSRDLFI